MGKMGDALRAAKKQSTVYTFTKEQLEAHDALVLAERENVLRARLEERMKAEYAEKQKELEEKIKECNAQIQREWDEREKLFHTGDLEDTFFNTLQYLIAVPCRVLIEKFGWQPPKTTDRRSKINRLCDYVIDEINAIVQDEMKDIRSYCDETFRLYGVKFEREE